MSPCESFIQSVEKIVPIGASEKNAITSVMIYKEYSKNEHLTVQGETENHLYFIHDGCIRNYAIHDGQEYSLDFYFSGSFTTSYMSFLLREPSTMSVQALVPSQILRIHYNDVQHLYSKFKNIEKLGRIITESLYIRRTKREFSFITETASQRYLNMIKSHS